MLCINGLNVWFHPLDQFEIIVLAFYWTGFGLPVGAAVVTNLTIICAIIVLIIRTFFWSVFDRGNFNVWELSAKSFYNLVKSIMKSNTSQKRSQYFTVLLFLFNFILLSNLVGLIPYSFTITSSFVVTFFLALSHFIGINIIGLFNHKWRLMRLLLPSGVPLVIATFLIVIEFVSYFAKVFSLSIRLFANMMSGHALLKILIGFSWSLLTVGSIYIVLSIFPWVVVTMIMFLEALIAFLQAYVFTILVTIYINDVLVVEH